MQAWLDAAVRLPQWLGFALVAVAVLVTLPGRHGQRPLNAALLGGAAFLLCFYGLRGVHPWLPGVSAIIAGAACALFGLVAVGWATAACVGLAFAAGGAALANVFHLLVLPTALLCAAFGFLAGVTNHKGLSLVLPPLFAGVLGALGAAIAWAPHWRGAKLWRLNDAEWVIGVAVAIAIPLLLLSLEREHRRRLRLEARTKRMEEEELKRKLEGQKKAWERAQRG